MLSNRLAFVVLGLACVAAAAGGGYMAVRHNVTEQPVSAMDGSGTAGSVALPPAAMPAVQETEGVVSSPAPAAASQPATRSASTPRTTQPQVVKPASARGPARTTTPARAAVEAAPPAPVVAPEHAPSAPSIPSATAPLELAPIVARAERPLDAPVLPEPPSPAFEELTVAADSVIGLQTETTLSSERARVEDRVEARVVRDVRAGGRVAIPAGSRALGSVVVVERGGRARSRARLGIRFHTLALADGTRVPISTETIYRFGDDPGNGSAAKIGGGAVAGAILGAIIGGGKGAAIGATTGAAGGGAAVMAGDRSEAVFPSGAQVTARIVSPVTITVDR